MATEKQNNLIEALMAELEDNQWKSWQDFATNSCIDLVEEWRDKPSSQWGPDSMDVGKASDLISELMEIKQEMG